MPDQLRSGSALSYLGLFSSVGTLLCCALPSLFVFLGFGGAVASLLSSAPWLVTLSHHKEWIFAGAGLLLLGGFYYTYRLAPRLLVLGGSCPADDPTACERATRMSRRLLAFSAGVYLMGFATAYLLPAVLEWIDR